MKGVMIQLPKNALPKGALVGVDNWECLQLIGQCPVNSANRKLTAHFPPGKQIRSLRIRSEGLRHSN
jgi:hypothetical protein